MKNNLLLLILFTVFAFSKVFSQDTINWRSDYVLKWEDFQGKADSTSEFGAISYVGIKYALSANEDSFNTVVLCYFAKKVSWVRVISNIGIIHEQGHFDIAELFARKLRKTFAEYRFNYNAIKQDFKEMYLLIKKERSVMDSLYDKETDFSRNKKQQLLWNKKIKAELDKLKKYASP